MFFKKFFSKSFEQVLTKADFLFNDGHYADARQYYLDALEKIQDSANEEQYRSQIYEMMAKCGNILAEMNICEAEAAIRSGNSQKAAEYLELSLELTDDVKVRESAEKLLFSLTQLSTTANNKLEPAEKQACSSCSSSSLRR